MKKNKILKILITAVSLIVGMAIGIAIGGVIIDFLGDDMNFGEYLLWLALFLAGLYLLYFFHIIAHEAGHLLFGLITGYRFASFRIGGLMITKRGGKIRLSKYSLAGTEGQCLLSPPYPENGKMPYVLYNFGGVIVNGVLALIAFGIYFILPKTSVFSVLLLAFSAVGLFAAMLNGIPMKLGLISNDGHNALSLSKDKDALRSFYCQLRINELVTEGKRLGEMPFELFSLPDDADTANPINNAIQVFACNRLMDEHKFTEAKSMAEKLLKNPGVIGLYKNMLVCDIIYCSLVCGEKEYAHTLLTDQQKKFMDIMSNNPSIVRTRYAYSLILENNTERANEYKNKIDKIAASYPYSGEMESEMSLVEEARRTKISEEI